MFELAGIDEPEAKAEQVMELETRLAKDHWDRVKSRDATLTYNKKDPEALAELTPGFDWPRYFASYGAAGRRRGDRLASRATSRRWRRRWTRSRSTAGRPGSSGTS